MIYSKDIFSNELFLEIITSKAILIENNFARNSVSEAQPNISVLQNQQKILF